KSGSLSRANKYYEIPKTLDPVSSSSGYDPIQSIRDTGSTKEMVVLVSDGVSDYAKKLLEHSERLNSGVMVVEPSEAVFNDMMSKVNTLPSYTGGDQGFLNSYYSGFPNSHVFDPNIPQEVLKVRPVPEMEQLSTLYNADVGLYMLANKWMVDESELHVIHYTLGPLKPWDWWTSWLLKPVDVWQTKVPVYLGGISVFVCFMAAVVSLGISIAIRGRRIVTQLTPVSADTDLFNSDPKKDHLQASSCDIVSWYYGLGMAFLVIVAPSLPCIFGITALFLRLGLMVVGGIILASFMTYASEHLAIRSFLKGCEDRDTTQSRECFLC
ncbi:hypothetical protein Gorai_019631, partial [Gossypium raimondii]|nr:hypothetical protein [Gossypium raimondii]